MSFYKVFIIFIFLGGSQSWASDSFSVNDYGNSDDEVHEDEPLLTDIQKEIICLSHKMGKFDHALELGIKVFGSERRFYKNYHQVQCPPYYPSPLYHSIENKYYAGKLYRELNDIHEYLSLEERQYLLNRPDEGRRRATLLDIAVITKKMFERGGATAEVPKLQLVIDKLKSMGAKSRREMTEEELSVYE